MYYSITKTAKVLGCALGSLWKHIEKGNVPRPSHRLEGVRHPVYTQADLDMILDWWRTRIPSGSSRFLQSDIDGMRADFELGLKPSQIAAKWGCHKKQVYNLLNGVVRPGRRGGPGRIKKKTQPETPDHYCSMARAAAYFGWRESTFREAVKQGRIPGPQHRRPGTHWPVYLDSELDSLGIERRERGWRIRTRYFEHVAGMRKMRREGCKQHVIARRFGCSAGYVSRLLANG